MSGAISLLPLYDFMYRDNFTLDSLPCTVCVNVQNNQAGNKCECVFSCMSFIGYLVFRVARKWGKKYASPVA